MILLKITIQIRMIKKFKMKFYKYLGVSSNSWTKDNRSFYRIFKFIFSIRGQKRLWSLFVKIFIFLIRKIIGINVRNLQYKKWAKQNFITKKQLLILKEKQKELTYRPLISIVLPVYDPPENFFIECIESVIDQIYPNWELCISDDVSPNENIRKIIKSYAEKDKRIKYVFRTENGHISAASNSAIEIATGEYLALLDHDDLITPDALYENVLALNNDREIDFLYSDEDKINEKGQFLDGHFKPDFCPDNFLSRNYICHFSVIRTNIIKEIGGFRIGLEGSQDYDIFLRAIEKCKKIHHIPKMLYHWRIHSESTALNMDTKPYATLAAVKALEDTLTRRNIKGKVESIDELPGFYKIKYDIETYKKVSIIIPSKNMTELTNICIKSIFNLTDYPDFEVILVNNNSDEDSFFEMVKKWEQKEPNRFKCITDNGDFNFSRLINNAAKEAKGDYLLLLNNDTEVTQPDWISLLVEQAQRESIGAVGVRLLYKNETIQHAGVIIGLRGIAGHPFVGADKNEPGYFNYLKSVNNFSAVTAACLMVRKSCFDEVNGFCEDLAIEFNDVDFCLKLKEKGYNNIFTPHVTLYHYESISRGHPHKTKESYEKHLKENKLFKDRWQKYIDHDPCYNKHLSLEYDDFRVKL
jgi:GT2 family glycosyltransferase